MATDPRLPESPSNISSPYAPGSGSRPGGSASIAIARMFEPAFLGRGTGPIIPPQISRDGIVEIF